MTADLASRLSRCYSAAVHDVMRGLGLSRFVLPPELRPLIPERRLAGPVQTVGGHLDESADAHETLLAWTGFLSKARPAHVVVCQPNQRVTAMMGELSSECLKLKGVLGYVVDGGCRDVEAILAQGFQVYCTFFTPRDIVGTWLPDAFGAPITIGEAVIHDGDFLLGDRDGIVVLPQGRAAEIVAATEAVMVKENKVRDAILAGVDPQEAYRRHGKF